MQKVLMTCGDYFKVKYLFEIMRELTLTKHMMHVIELLKNILGKIF